MPFPSMTSGITTSSQKASNALLYVEGPCSMSLKYKEILTFQILKFKTPTIADSAVRKINSSVNVVNFCFPVKAVFHLSLTFQAVHV